MYSAPSTERKMCIRDRDEEGPNVKIVAAVSRDLFMAQSDDYRGRVLPEDEWQNSMCVTNISKKLMSEWTYSKKSEMFGISADWDNRWRTGGTISEVLDEAHLTERWILEEIRRFASAKNM